MNLNPLRVVLRLEQTPASGTATDASCSVAFVQTQRQNPSSNPIPHLVTLTHAWRYSCVCVSVREFVAVTPAMGSIQP